jgi:hypothetical protein
MNLYFHITHENEIKYDINLDLEFFKAASTTFKCYFLNENDAYVSVTGATLYLTIKSLTTDTDGISGASAILTKDIDADDFDPQNGNIDIVLDETDTNLTVGCYIYDIRLKDSNGEIFVVAEGTICVKQNLTTRDS